MSGDLRVLVVGLGLVSRFWLPVLASRAGVVVAGVVEPDVARVEAARRDHGLAAPGYTTLEQALVGCTCDVVANLTPPAAHRATIEQALEAGCHVLTEKPLALTFADARAVVELADSRGLMLGVMQNRRFQPAIRALAAGVAAGTIGEAAILCADMFMGPVHPASYLAAQESPLLLEMAVHTFDQARYLSGRDAVSVSCLEFNPPHSWYGGAAAAICTFELAGGVVFSYRGDWVAEGHPTSYDAAWRVSGARGTALWDGFGDPTFEVALPRTEPYGAAPVRRGSWRPGETRDATGHAACLDEMLDALEQGRPAETSGSDNLRSMGMVFAALESARERRVVDLTELA